MAKEIDVLINTIDDGFGIGENVLLPEALLGITIDFVTEQGDNFRKWNSGRLEQWGVITKNLAINTAYGNLYRTSSNESHVFAIEFIERPSITISSMSNSCFGAYFNDVSYRLFTWRPVHVLSQTVEVRIGWNAIGRWK